MTDNGQFDKEITDIEQLDGQKKDAELEFSNEFDCHQKTLLSSFDVEEFDCFRTSRPILSTADDQMPW